MPAVLPPSVRVRAQYELPHGDKGGLRSIPAGWSRRLNYSRVFPAKKKSHSGNTGRWLTVASFIHHTPHHSTSWSAFSGLSTGTYVALCGYLPTYHRWSSCRARLTVVHVLVYMPLARTACTQSGECKVSMCGYVPRCSLIMIVHSIRQPRGRPCWISPVLFIHKAA